MKHNALRTQSVGDSDEESPFQNRQIDSERNDRGKMERTGFSSAIPNEIVSLHLPTVLQSLARTDSSSKRQRRRRGLQDG